MEPGFAPPGTTTDLIRMRVEMIRRHAVQKFLCSRRLLEKAGRHRAAAAVALICLAVWAAVSSRAHAARDVTDPLGRQVSVPDTVERVVALAPSIAEMVFALGQEHRLVGVTRFSDYPPAVRELPRVGSYIHLDLERIVALRPDLCIAIKDGNPKAVIDRLGTLGIPVYAVNPGGLVSVMDTLRRIGGLLDAEDRAAAIVADMANRMHQVDEMVASVTDRPRVFFQIGITPIVSIGSDTFIHELIVRAGGRNLAEKATGYPRYSEEQILTMAPDVIIVTTMSREEGSREAIQRWAQWPNLPAVQNDRVFLEDSNLFDRPSPRIVDALERLVRRFHPELGSP